MKSWYMATKPEFLASKKDIGCIGNRMWALGWLLKYYAAVKPAAL